MYRYIAIIFPPDSTITDDIVSISNSILNEVEYEGVTLVSFETAMTKNEVFTFLKQNSDNRTFVLSEIDNIMINIPEDIKDYLLDNSENKLESLGTKAYFTFESDEEMNNFKKTLSDNELIYSDMYFGFSVKEETPIDYIKTLTSENKSKEYEKLISKLPNLNDWEAEVLKLLINEQ